MNASCSMFSQILKLIPRTDFERIVKADGFRISQQGLVELEPVRWHAVLSVGARPFAAGDRRRAEELRRQAGPPGHRRRRSAPRCPTPTATVRGSCSRRSSTDCSRPSPPSVQGTAQVPLQEQAGQPRLDRDRPVPVSHLAGDQFEHLSALAGWLSSINLMLALFNQVPGFRSTEAGS